MHREVYRYNFAPEVPLEDIEGALLLSILGVESLHGESQARLDVGHIFDPVKRLCVIDAGTDVGKDLNRLFVGFVRRELGEDAFRVERVADDARQPEEAHA
jgi:hypothetical protein